MRYLVLMQNNLDFEVLTRELARALGAYLGASKPGEWQATPSPTFPDTGYLGIWSPGPEVLRAATSLLVRQTLGADPVFRGIKMGTGTESCHGRVGEKESRTNMFKNSQGIPKKTEPNCGCRQVWSILGYRVESRWTGREGAGVGAGDV